MQCLTKYVLHPTFLDPAFSMAIKLAQEMIDQLNQSINKQLDTAMASKVNLDVDRTLESIHCRELQDLISRLEDEARAKSKPEIIQPASKEDKGKGKKAIAQNRPSSRVLKNNTTNSDSLSSLEEEQDTIPPLAKRKRSSEASRGQGPSFCYPTSFYLNKKCIPSKCCTGKWIYSQAYSNEWSCLKP